MQVRLSLGALITIIFSVGDLVLLYVNRIEPNCIFITDTDDNITESVPYSTLYNLISTNKVNIFGTSICNNKLIIRKFKKNSIVINSLLGNEDAIKLVKEYSTWNSISLDELSMQSNKEVFWHCFVCNNDYKSTPNRRLNSVRNRNCPYCAGYKVKKGFNDVATTHPYILLDWDFESNVINPYEITAGSSHVANFKCKICGCKYSSPVSTKTRAGRENLGCPDCAARRNVRGYSLNEKFLFTFLSKYYECRDRVHFDKLEFDIFIPSLNILIEYDGNYWHEFKSKLSKDLYKNQYAIKNNFKLIRIRESNLEPLSGCKNIMMKDFNNSITDVANYLLDYIKSIK